MTKISHTIKLLQAGLIAIGFLALSYYIIQLGAMTNQRHTLYEYKDKLAMMADNKSKLDIELSKSDSLENIENHFAQKDFVKADNIKYIQIFRDSVVNR